MRNFQTKLALPMHSLVTASTKAACVMRSGSFSAINTSMLESSPTSRVDGFSFVLTRMVGLIAQKLKVFGAVIKFIVVDMVDDFGGQQWPAQDLLHNNAVFLNVIAPGFDKAITSLKVRTAIPSRVIDTTHDVVAITASPGAEVTLLHVGRENKNRFATKGTLKVNWHNQSVSCGPLVCNLIHNVGSQS